MGKRFLFTCGGTGGHIYPAIAAAQRLQALLPDAEFLFVGAEDNLETELVPREGFPIETLRVGNLHRSLKPREILHNLRSAAWLASSLGKAGRLLRRFRPDAVLGTGGYVCYPVLRAASARGIPTLLHEANALPGLTTRMLEKYTDAMMVGFAESAARYAHPQRIHVTGIPVRSGFREADRAAARRSLGIPEGQLLILSFGGSLGAKRLNAALAQAAAENEKTGAFRLLHATGGGEAGLEAMKRELASHGVTEPRYTELRPYIYDMPQVMAAADLVICRAGASTLGELAAAGKPAVLIPYPYATGNHQEINAQVTVDRGAAVLLRDADCSGERLSSLLRELCAAPEQLRRMGDAMKSLDRPDALDAIVQLVLEQAKL